MTVLIKWRLIFLLIVKAIGLTNGACIALGSWLAREQNSFLSVCCCCCCLVIIDDDLDMVNLYLIRAWWLLYVSNICNFSAPCNEWWKNLLCLSKVVEVFHFKFACLVGLLLLCHCQSGRPSTQSRHVGVSVIIQALLSEFWIALQT